MDIIKALKENCRPFGLMSEEMQAKMTEFWKSRELEVLNCAGIWKIIDNHNEEVPWKHITYRLRPDYTEDEGAPLKFKVFDDEEALGFDGGEGIQGVNLSECVNHPDFIGYLYEDGCISAFPRLYQLESGDTQYMYYPVMGNYEVLTPTHVLFRGKK